MHITDSFIFKAFFVVKIFFLSFFCKSKIEPYLLKFRITWSICEMKDEDIWDVDKSFDILLQLLNKFNNFYLEPVQTNFVVLIKNVYTSFIFYHHHFYLHAKFNFNLISFTWNQILNCNENFYAWLIEWSKNGTTKNY